MFRVPVTFLFDFERVDDSMRPYVFHEFAANGAKHLVLTDTLISRIMQNYSLTDQLKKELTQEGLDFIDAHSPFGARIDLCNPDPLMHRHAMIRHTLAMEICSLFGVDTITIHVGNNHAFPETPLNVLVDQIKRSLAELLPVAERLKITVCIENIWFSTNTTEVLRAVKKEFSTAVLGFCYDAGHANLTAKGLQFEQSAAVDSMKAQNSGNVINDHVLEDLLPDVVNCHLHDNDGQWDYHRNIGCGNVDWNHVIPLLNSAPRLKNVQSEVIPARTNTSIHDVCEAFRKLNEIQ